MSWIRKRSACVEVGIESSYFFKITKGTVQGSVLGPILFAIFMCDVIEVEQLTMFADDNYIVTGADNVNELEAKLEDMTNRVYNWLTNSGMKVNADKTEMIVFSKAKVKAQITVNGKTIKSKESIKILGVQFDSKLEWSKHIEGMSRSLKSVSYGISKLRNYFTQPELLGLVTTLGYSKMYYGSPVWLSRGLHDINQKKLMRTSAALIKAAVVCYW